MEGLGGGKVMVTARDGMDKIIASGKYPYLVRVGWDYNSGADGFPDEIDAELMGRVADALEAEFNADKCAYLVAVVTGEGHRDWLFYAHSLPIFGKVFNRALAPVPETVPFVIDAQSDPDWTEYADLRSQTYIPPEES